MKTKHFFLIIHRKDIIITVVLNRALYVSTSKELKSRSIVPTYPTIIKDIRNHGMFGVSNEIRAVLLKSNLNEETPLMPNKMHQRKCSKKLQW